MYLLTQQEAAEQTRLSERTPDRPRLAGTGPKFVRLGRRVVYRREDLEGWIAANICRSTSEADAMAVRCGETQAANSCDLERPIEEISVAMSPRHQKTDHPYPHPPLAGRGAPFDFGRHQTRNKF